MKDGLRALNEAEGRLFKLGNDPRITRVDHFPGRTSLDELPQLLNVRDLGDHGCRLPYAYLARIRGLSVSRPDIAHG